MFTRLPKKHAKLLCANKLLQRSSETYGKFRGMRLLEEVPQTEKYLSNCDFYLRFEHNSLNQTIIYLKYGVEDFLKMSTQLVEFFQKFCKPNFFNLIQILSLYIEKICTFFSLKRL